MNRTYEKYGYAVMSTRSEPFRYPLGQYAVFPLLRDAQDFAAKRDDMPEIKRVKLLIGSL